MSVTETVSDALETPLEELPPLSRAIDPDALERLTSSNERDRPPGVIVSFKYAGLEVVVHSGNMVYAQPISGEGDGLYDDVDFNA